VAPPATDLARGARRRDDGPTIYSAEVRAGIARDRRDRGQTPTRISLWRSKS